MRSNTAFGAALLLSLSGCTLKTEIAESAPEGTDQQALFYGNLWDDESISVCWFASGFETEKTWIRDAVTKTFEDITPIDFTGWGRCNGGEADVVINMRDDLWPETTVVGFRVPSADPSVRLNPLVGEKRALPTDPKGDNEIDFDSCWTEEPESSLPRTGQTGRTWESRHRQCVEVMALHEFFHVLAAVHEQNRPDNPEWCTKENDGEDGSPFGYWDITSLSNYCNPVWYADGRPSLLDYTGLQVFYGYETDDQWWFGIGNVRNYASVNWEQLLFELSNSHGPPSGNKIPLVGDFDGHGQSDILFYGPGSEPDSIYYGQSDRHPHVHSESIPGNYTPIVGNFDGKEGDDIFWYTPTGQDRLWWGKSTGETFEKEDAPDTKNQYDKPLAGDFNCDGKDDIFWYVSGSAEDKLWFGRSDRTFDKTVPTNAIKVYQPFVGDFDGDDCDDIFWYSPTDQDKIWFGESTGTFDSVSVSINGSYHPAVGKFDDNNTSDIIWSGPYIEDKVWVFAQNSSRGAKRTSYVSSHLGADSPGDHSKPYVGDFDGDGKDDVFWYKPN